MPYQFSGEGLVCLSWLCSFLEKLAPLTYSQSEPFASSHDMAADLHRSMVYIGIGTLVSSL